jgi:hypothetical protein
MSPLAVMVPTDEELVFKQLLLQLTGPFSTENKSLYTRENEGRRSAAAASAAAEGVTSSPLSHQREVDNKPQDLYRSAPDGGKTAATVNCSRQTGGSDPAWAAVSLHAHSFISTGPTADSLQLLWLPTSFRNEKTTSDSRARGPSIFCFPPPSYPPFLLHFSSFYYREISTPQLRFQIQKQNV